MKALHVWAAIETFGVVYRFYEPNMSGDKYKEILAEVFEELRQRGINLSEFIYQHDGASPHYRRDVREFLDQYPFIYNEKENFRDHQDHQILICAIFICGLV